MTNFLKKYWAILLVVIFTGIVAFELNRRNNKWENQVKAKDKAMEAVFSDDESLMPALASNKTFRRIIMDKYGDEITFRIDTIVDTMVLIDTFFQYIPGPTEYVYLESPDVHRLRADSAFYSEKLAMLRDTVLNLRMGGLVSNVDEYTKMLDSVLAQNDSMSVVIGILEEDNIALESELIQLQDVVTNKDSLIKKHQEQLFAVYQADKKLRAQIRPYIGGGLSGTRYQGTNIVTPAVQVGVGITIGKNKSK